MDQHQFDTAIRVAWLVITACCVSILWLINVYLLENSPGSEWFFLAYSIPLLVTSTVFIMLLYNLRRAFAEGKAEIAEGEVLVRWSYSEPEWSSFNEAEWKKSRDRSVGIPLAFFVIFLIIGWLDQEFSEGAVVVALPHVAVFFLSISAGLLYYTRAMYRRTMSCPRNVIIGYHGLLYGGNYMTWDAFGTWLAGVRCIPGKNPVLEFDVKVIGMYGSNSQPWRIPVPSGCVGESDRIIAALMAHRR
jgi:uncharacterized membrane protein YhdT